MSNACQTSAGGDALLLAVDIGGTKFIVGFVDMEGGIVFQRRHEWEGKGQDDIVRQVVDAVADALDARPDVAGRVIAGGVTIPGFCDPLLGTWVDSDFLKVKDLPICDILRDKFDVPFFADNDGNACALAEQYFGGARGCKNALYVTVSTGIGGALILDDEIVYGAHNQAGEVGLVFMERDGDTLDNGQTGVLESMACGRGLVNRYLEAGGAPTICVSEVDGKVIGVLALADDAAALAALDVEGRYLGRALAGICQVVPCERVIMGGGVSMLFDLFASSLRDEFDRCYRGPAVSIGQTGLGYTGAFVGAAALALRGLAGRLPKRHEPDDDRLEVMLSREGIGCRIVSGGREVPCEDGRGGDLGAFMLAEGIQDAGIPLELMIRSFPFGRPAYDSGVGDTAVPPAVGSLLEATDVGDILDRRAPEDDFMGMVGYWLGRALAFHAVVLDPGVIVIRGLPKNVSPAFGKGLAKALKEETYYRGDLPFDVLIA